MSSFHACMIAGTHSGAGKTTVMFALEALARHKGLAVQPFKGGPDYIDPGFHDKATGRKCRNLDLFLLTPKTVKQSFLRNSQDADLVLIEGMMGLFDGKNAAGEGSSAEIAKLLGIPVVLVVDGSGMAGSGAAVVLGFQKMDLEIKLSGVIFNRVNSEGHFRYLKNAVESKTDVPCLGFLPKDKTIGIPERHLGLTTAVESETVSEKISLAAALIEKHLDWEKFLEVTIRNPKHEICHPRESGDQEVLKDWIHASVGMTQKTPRTNLIKFRIGVARDEAFSFYYEDNFDLLEGAGAGLCFFSPLEDQKLPRDLDLLYFGGGFPEIYAKRLAANQAMIESVRSFYQEDGWIYAECGGLIFLAQAFCDGEGQEHALAGLVPGKIQMTERLQQFGYKELETASETFLFPKGKKIRSHEFHHSVWDGEGQHAPVYKIGARSEGFAAERLIASYQHLHFGSDPEILGHLRKNLMKRKVTL